MNVNIYASHNYIFDMYNYPDNQNWRNYSGKKIHVVTHLLTDLVILKWRWPEATWRIDTKLKRRVINLQQAKFLTSLHCGALWFMSKYLSRLFHLNDESCSISIYNFLWQSLFFCKYIKSPCGIRYRYPSDTAWHSLTFAKLTPIKSRIQVWCLLLKLVI